MDNLTHTLIGVGLARSGLSTKFGRGTTLVLALTSNLPDLDVFWGFIHPGESFLYRRMLTHSLIGIPILSTLAAFLFRWRYPHLTWKTLLGLSALGIGTHVLFDLVNSYGVVLFYPITRWRWELAWVFIIDLALWALLALPLALSAVKRFRPYSDRLFQIFMLSVLSYVGLCGVNRAFASAMLDQWVTKEHLEPAFSYVFPEALGFHRWRGVVRQADTYHVVLLHVFRNKSEVVDVVKTQGFSEPATAVRDAPMGRAFEWFFKAPVWLRAAAPDKRSEKTLETWTVYDLRFQSAVIGRRNPFVYQFVVSGDGIRYVGRGEPKARM